jgi:hypothetical protein
VKLSAKTRAPGQVKSVPGYRINVSPSKPG